MSVQIVCTVLETTGRGSAPRDHAYLIPTSVVCLAVMHFPLVADHGKARTRQVGREKKRREAESVQ